MFEEYIGGWLLMFRRTASILFAIAFLFAVIEFALLGGLVSTDWPSKFVLAVIIIPAIASTVLPLGLMLTNILAGRSKPGSAGFAPMTEDEKTENFEENSKGGKF